MDSISSAETTEFFFKDFTPATALKWRANQALDRILDLAPYGARPIAILERDGDGYRCSVELYSKQGPFIASCVGPTADQAIESMERSLSEKLQKWRKSRFKTRPMADRLTTSDLAPSLKA